MMQPVGVFSQTLAASHTSMCFQLHTPSFSLQTIHEDICDFQAEAEFTHGDILSLRQTVLVLSGNTHDK